MVYLVIMILDLVLIHAWKKSGNMSTRSRGTFILEIQVS
jgi:hypothetical protein